LAQNNIIGRRARLERAIELKCKGLTDKEISARMMDEGYQYVSFRTINRILNTVSDERITEELKRLQLRDITTADSPIRLKYRDKMLEKLMPRKVEQKLSGELKQEVKFPELKGLDEDAVGAIVQNFMEDEARRLRQAESGNVLGAEERPEDEVDTPR